MNRHRLLLIATLPLAASLQPIRAQSVMPLTLGQISKTAADWPLFVANGQGYFQANGLTVDSILTNSGAAGAQQMSAGALDIAAISAPQAIEAIAGGAPLRIVAVHTNVAPYFVIGKKGITSLAQLKGKTIVVGGPNDLTRVFMDRVLESAHLGPSDYTYTYAGSTTERYAALLSGGVDAAILFPPLSFRAVADGFPILAETYRYFPTFLNGVFVTRPEWAKTHRDTVVRFIKSYVQAAQWLYEPGHKERALQLLTDATSTSRSDAVQTYDLFISKVRLYSTDGVPSLASIQAVEDVLVKLGEIKPPAPPPSGFVDSQYVAAANAQLRRR